MQNQNKQMFSPPFNNGCFWTLANCKLLLLAVLLKLLVSIMVFANARDFIDVRKQKRLIHGPQLPDALNRDRIRDQIWTLLLTVCNTVVCFSPEIRVLQVILLSVWHSLQNFRLTARILNQSVSAARQHSCLLFPQNQFCKPSYFPFSHSRTFVLNPQWELFGSLSSQCSLSPIFSWNCLIRYTASYPARLFTVLYFSVRSSRSSAGYRLPCCMSVKTTLGAGGGLRGSEKNRGTVITSMQLAFRRRDRNYTPFTIH